MHKLLIGITSITQYIHMHNKNSNTQGSLPYVVKVIFHYNLKELPLKEKRERIFPLREVPIFKRDVIVENHCLIQ